MLLYIYQSLLLDEQAILPFKPTTPHEPNQTKTPAMHDTSLRQLFSIKEILGLPLSTNKK